MSAFYNGYSSNAKLNFNSTEDSVFPAVTVDVNYNTINGYVKSTVPILFPFGFISLPIDNANCAYVGTGGYYAAAIAGYTNSLKKISNMSDLLKGESGIYSTGNFTLKSKLDGLISTFTNQSDTIITTILPISENIVTILIDIINEIIALEANYNALITTFNNFNANFLAHTHSGVTTGGGNTGGTLTNFPHNPNYTETSNFNRDYNFINQSPSKMYININGVVLS